MEPSGSVAAQPTPPLVLVNGINKRFGGVRALRDVSLEVRAGEVHALLGENGAGKSTLIKILSGVHAFDSGSIEIAGRRAAFDNPAKSREAGIAVVYQDLSLVESLSVADNLLLGREPRTRFGFVRKRELMAQAEAFLTQLGIPLDIKATVGSLPFAYRQMTEIAKALMGEVRLLSLDEPTSSLTSDEVRILFEAIGKVTRRGVGVIYVTHRLNEVFEISQRVTVLRDGANAGTFVTADTDMKRLVNAIVGIDRALPVTTRAGPQAARGFEVPPVLSLSNVSNDRMRDVDLSILKGEIHGLAGLIGSGRTEILETIFGLRPVEHGTLQIDGRGWLPKNPADAIDRGIALVPEDRHVQGLVLDHSIERNVTLSRLSYFSRWGWMQQAAAARRAETAIGRLAVKAPGASSLVRTLSGGNQQKVVFGKWNDPRPRVLLLDEPTVGVDVGAREEIYGVIRHAARDGTAVLVVSSDLVELIELCDRISVIVDGCVARTLVRGEIDDAEELHHLLQLYQASGQGVLDKAALHELPA
ncbi:sugar ABC transporter ATP-binding protein [Bradyrhizobium septentrionale]|uniref:sugar ABC transporter ATP-binding protein n=1 Tax=Bradyrhizobium septentrionale TaxID=1404411 RepID=UPI00140ADDD9|nr:sugar ABC transporter ATP-binding protein [Bradyrhizobium septentrionale]UGY13411.1 sugar ABC transporter ATP-binding protein [Bradyrhizobium septentrionale]